MNKRILFFHSHIWRGFFRDLMTHLVHEQGCRAAVVSHHPDKHHWRHLVKDGAAHFTLPDLRRVRPFESEPNGREEAQALVDRCERAAGKSASRILLSSERDMGKAFSQGFFLWPDNPLLRWCRADQDRPRLALLRAFDFVRQAFDEFRPDLVLTRSISENFSLAAWFLCQERGIPVHSCRFSKLASKKAFWTDDYNMYNTLADERFLELDRSGAEPGPAFVQAVRQFRDKPATVDYIAQNWKRASGQGAGEQVRSLLQVFREELRWYRKGRQGPKPHSAASKLAEACRVGVNARRNARLFRTFSPEELASFRYAYMPLHKEPELMLNFESLLCHDQRHLVKFLAGLLPTGLKLLVKEHRLNWGRRSRAYLKFLADLPGVVLVHPFADQFAYLRHADVVITDNGSTGWEGLLLKKPVITLEKTLYDAPGLTRQAMDPRLAETAMLDALAEPFPFDPDGYDRKLALRLEAEDQTTLPIEAMHQDMGLSVEAIKHLLQRSRA